MIKGPGIGLRKAERVSQRSTATSARCSFFLAIRVQHRRRWKARFRKPPPTFKAVKDIDLDIQDGEFMVLVGPSGCGKSTTLRMVAGLEKITSGTISIGGRVVNELSQKTAE